MEPPKMKDKNEIFTIQQENWPAYITCLCFLSIGFIAKLYSFFKVETAIFAGDAGKTASAVIVLLMYVAAFICFAVSIKRNSLLAGVITFFSSLLYESFPLMSGFHNSEEKYFRFRGILYVQGIFCVVAIVIIALFAARIITNKSAVMLVASVSALFVIMINVAASATTESYSDYTRGLNDWSLTIARCLFILASTTFLEFGSFTERSTSKLQKDIYVKEAR